MTAWAVALAARAATVEAQGDAAGLLQKIGAYVEQYYARARSFVAVESVVVETLRPDLVADGLPRRLNYDLRVDWIPRVEHEPAKALMTRQLLTVNGRKPKPKDKPECLDPIAEETEPMSMLLPEEQTHFKFRWAGQGKVAGRSVAMLDFQETGAVSTSLSFKGDDCLSAHVSGRSIGRVWADAATGEVMRLDVSLKGMVDFRVPRERQLVWGTVKTLDRSDVSVQYRPVTFFDPDETLLVPSSIVSLWAWRGGGRYRKTQTFRHDRRFVAEGRLVDSVEPAPDRVDQPEVTPTR